MPRRISDYPDAFAGWNLISSFGSIISVVATWLFLYILYAQLVEGKATSRYPWLTPQFYSDSLQTLLNRSYNSLEWSLNSPPKPHAFVSLPLQSSFSFSGIFTSIKTLIILMFTSTDNYSKYFIKILGYIILFLFSLFMNTVFLADILYCAGDLEETLENISYWQGDSLALKENPTLKLPDSALNADQKMEKNQVLDALKISGENRNEEIADLKKIRDAEASQAASSSSTTQTLGKRKA